ncbi:hypothetical protein [Streptomyces sp. NPDC053367]|uniref:hypothetical protein n=1 Tax=Streptomyces sp. NPDC053367 TaxID=3365700 RepID=UPI0037D62BB7
MNLRLLALAGVAACAIALPLAVASAGPAGDDEHTTVRLPGHASHALRDSGAARDATADGSGPSGGAGTGRSDGSSGPDAPDGSVGLAGSAGPGGGGPGGSGPGGSGPGGGDGFDGVDAKGLSGGAARSPLLLGLGTATAARCGPELTSPEGVEAQTCVLNQGAETWARTYYRNRTGEPLRAVLSFMGPGARTVQMRCAVSADDEPASCETPRERTRAEPAGYSAVAEFAGTRPDGPLLLRSGSNS